MKFIRITFSLFSLVTIPAWADESTGNAFMDRMNAINARYEKLTNETERRDFKTRVQDRLADKIANFRRNAEVRLVTIVESIESSNAKKASGAARMELPSLQEAVRNYNRAQKYCAQFGRDFERIGSNLRVQVVGPSTLRSGQQRPVVYRLLGIGGQGKIISAETYRMLQGARLLTLNKSISLLPPHGTEINMLERRAEMEFRVHEPKGLLRGKVPVMKGPSQIDHLNSIGTMGRI